MQLEKMACVYECEYGAPPDGEGASNIAFFVEAKLAFGWFGVIFYCLIFSSCAACIIASGRRLLVVSSSVCFIIAAVSSLSATLLIGGLFLYIVLALLLSPVGDSAAVSEEP